MKAKNTILILVAGSLAKEVFESIEDSYKVYFFDDVNFTKNDFCGKKVFHDFNEVPDKDVHLVCAVGEPSGLVIENLKEKI